MGGGALGGNASTILLAQIQLEEVPAGPLAWMTHRSSLAAGESLSHNHPFALVYAERGSHGLKSDLLITEVFAEDTGHTAGQQETIVSTLNQGEGAAVRPGSNHVHEASGGPSTFWEPRLDFPDYILADPAV